MSKYIKEKYVPCPHKPVSTRGGCKVGWATYATQEEADDVSAWANKEGHRKSRLGYDFGYCSPGTIEKVPDGYEVCLP